VREPTPVWPQHVREDVEEVDPENVRRMRKVLLLGDCLKTQITPLMIVAQRLGSPTRRWTTLEGEARKTLKPSWRQLTPPGCVSFYVCKYRKGKLPDLQACLRRSTDLEWYCLTAGLPHSKIPSIFDHTVLDQVLPLSFLPVLYC